MSQSIVLERLPTGAKANDLHAHNLTRKRIYILPTRQGMSYLLLLIIMLLGAVNYNNSMAYLLTFLLGSLLLIGILHTFRNMAGLIIEAQSAPSVFAGEMAAFPLSIDNRFGPQRLSLAISSQQKQRKRFSIGVEDHQVDIDLAAGKIHTAYFKQETYRRGYLKSGRIIVSTCYPIGLFRAWSYLDIDRQCLVYPRPAGNQPLPEPDSGNTSGKQAAIPGVDDFIGFRGYHHGDSIRNIAWKVLARDEELLVKRFSAETGDTLILKWDQVLYEDIESRISQLCLWLLQAERRGLMYGLEIPGALISIGHGDSHLENCLTTLATWNGSYGS